MLASGQLDKPIEENCALILYRFGLKMTETTVFNFKIRNTFAEWAKVFDGQANREFLQEVGITPLYRGSNTEDSQRAIVIFQ